jgi:hypothetical protein
MGKNKIIVFVVLIFGLMSLYNNCSKVSVESMGQNKDSGQSLNSTSTDSNAPTDITVDSAIANCEQAKVQNSLKTYTQVINFADTKKESGRANVCIFKSGSESDKSVDANGNMTMKNDYLRSRYEQSANLNLPANAVVCAAEIKASKQAFYYDDIFYFSLNNKVLASSLKASLSKTTKQDYNFNGNRISIYDYDWSKFINSSFVGVNSHPDDYCIGSAEGFGKCQWPLSQQSGYIEMGFDPEVLVPISISQANSLQKFSFVVTGDNDPSSDCYHENIDFNVKILYYTK